jgi:hypothetical protein
MPLALARFDAPFDHPDFIFEPKMDGFRAVAYVEGGACRLVSRKIDIVRTSLGFASLGPGNRRPGPLSVIKPLWRRAP